MVDWFSVIASNGCLVLELAQHKLVYCVTLTEMVKNVNLNYNCLFPSTWECESEVLHYNNYTADRQNGSTT